MDHIEQLRRQLEQAQREGNERARFTLLGELGNALFARGDFPQASEAYQQALEIAGQTQDVAGKAATLSNLGNVYTEQGMKQSIALYQEALQLAREIGDRSLEGSTLNNLGLAYDKFGDEGREKGLFEKTLQIAREVGDQPLRKSEKKKGNSTRLFCPQQLPQRVYPNRCGGGQRDVVLFWLCQRSS